MCAPSLCRPCARIETRSLSLSKGTPRSVETRSLSLSKGTPAKPRLLLHSPSPTTLIHSRFRWSSIEYLFRPDVGGHCLTCPMTFENPPLSADPYLVALDEVAALDTQIARLSAVRARRVTEAQRHLHRQAPADTSTAGPTWSTARVERVELLTELALLTRRTEYRTAVLVDTSTTLVDRLPATLAAVAAGAVSWEHAEVIAKHAENLDGDALATYDARLAVLAAEVNPKQLEN